MDLENEVKTVIAEQLGIDVLKVCNGSTLEQLGGDMLDMVELVLGLELTFQVKINDDMAVELNTVQSFIDCVANAVGAQK